ncbi:MAG: hypothetical protein BHW65_09145 [Verrucomicrobia bacterium CAG:312_58_20]|nr:MAG: hypothetical protein BHW65_09145 [Verrucomicrobia bacterium CAG:312_58_20]
MHPPFWSLPSGSRASRAGKARNPPPPGRVFFKNFSDVANRYSESTVFAPIIYKISHWASWKYIFREKIFCGIFLTVRFTPPRPELKNCAFWKAAAFARASKIFKIFAHIAAS